MKLLIEKHIIPDKRIGCLDYYYDKYGDLEEVKVNCLEVNNNLFLEGLPIKELPDNLEANGHLDLTGTLIRILPNNLIVKKNLYIRNTPIKKLPKSLIVKWSLYLGRTPLYKSHTTKEIRKMAKYIEEKIYFF